MFSKRKGATSSDKKVKKEKEKGAHELFLEYEGFLAPPKPKPKPKPRPESSLSKRSTPLTYEEFLREQGLIALPEDSVRNSTVSHRRPRKDVSDGSRSQPKRTSSQRTKSFLAFGKTPHDEPGPSIHNFSRPGPNYVAEKEASSQSHTSGWLRRCMSNSLKHRPSTPPSMTPPPSYDSSLIFDDADFTALPALPGCTTESTRPSFNLASGAAARAAAAAQNEILDSMRNISLGESHLRRDSESGVGIEIGDDGETIAEFDFDIPVVRQGMERRGCHNPALLIVYQILYQHFHRNLSDTYSHI